jgi:hypothetical protein
MPSILYGWLNSEMGDDNTPTPSAEENVIIFELPRKMLITKVEVIIAIVEVKIEVAMIAPSSAGPSAASLQNCLCCARSQL